MVTDERNRILGMVEAGQISAAQAAQLLDALVMQQYQRIEHTERLQSHTIRIWITDMTTRRQKIKLTATLPVYLLSVSLRMLSRLAPHLDNNTIQHILETIERGNTGRVLDVQDLEEGKRLEIFVEQ